jgi:hypothetical protein
VLTETHIRAAKPKAKPYKLTDSKGLYLAIVPAGGRWWRHGANVFVELTGYIVRANSVTYCTVPESLTSQGVIQPSLRT